MTTHEFADALTLFAKVRKRGPQVPLDSLNVAAHPTPNLFFNQGAFQPQQAASALALLSGLSEIGKDDWRSLINYFAWPISIDNRDSARNVLGKVLTFLQENPGAQKRLKQMASTPSASTSPALMEALKALMES